MPLSEKERKSLYSIRVASENDPTKPEFPPDSPKFPATPTYKIKVPDFSNVWLKDESHNPTGTHKDRMAWEMVVTYRDFLLAKKRGQFQGKLPRMSIITSGSAAVAIQTLLTKYNLPNLKCLVDVNLDEEIVLCLKEMGCEIYKTDLSKKPFHLNEAVDDESNNEINSEQINVKCCSARCRDGTACLNRAKEGIFCWKHKAGRTEIISVSELYSSK
ncbi:MAG: pyridoxal-phosphate dependent enzyme [Nanoarchaeota archaeon]